MTSTRLEALARLRLEMAAVPDDVWRPAPHHVDDVSRVVQEQLRRLLERTTHPADAGRAGVVLRGGRGSGKTHMLGWIREQVHREGGSFLLLDLNMIDDFWTGITSSTVDGLHRPGPGGHSQVRTIVRRLASRINLPAPVRSALAGETPVTRRNLDAFVAGLSDYAPALTPDCLATARGLALFGSNSAELQDLGSTYLLGHAEDETGDLDPWGLSPEERAPESIYRDIIALHAITGRPLVIGIEGIHLAAAVHGTAMRTIADGLASLLAHDVRGLVVVAAYPVTWEALSSSLEQLVEVTSLTGVDSSRTGQQLVGKRFGIRFAEIGFEPPYPTWPIKPAAFATAVGQSPRAVLRAASDHARSCSLEGEVHELDRLDFGGDSMPAPPPAPVPVSLPAAAMARTDEQFNILRREADTFSPMDPATEDVTMPSLLVAGLQAWIIEQGETEATYSLDELPAGIPAVHARLRRTSADGAASQWAFRSLAASHGVAVLARLRRAMAISAAPQLWLLRNSPWPSGRKVQEALVSFLDAGGAVATVDDEDLRILTALERIFRNGGPDLPGWILMRRPTRDISFLRRALDSTDGG